MGFNQGLNQDPGSGFPELNSRPDKRNQNPDWISMQNIIRHINIKSIFEFYSQYFNFFVDNGYALDESDRWNQSDFDFMTQIDMTLMLVTDAGERSCRRQVSKWPIHLIGFKILATDFVRKSAT